MNVLLRRISHKIIRYSPKFILLFAIFATLIFSFSTAYALTGQNWTRATDSPGWEPRHNFGAVVFKNKMWVLGGRITGDFVDDVYSSSDGITWTEVVQAAGPHWSPRAYHRAVVFDDGTGEKMWVMGGYDAVEEVYVNDVWSSTDGVTWEEETSAALWSARGYFGAVVYSGQIWVMGGYDGVSDVDTIYSSPNGIDWAAVPGGTHWSAREGFSLVVLNDSMWVMGGVDLLGDDLNDVWYSELGGADWAEVPGGADWTVRRGQEAVAANGEMWVMGGYDGSDGWNDVWSSANGDIWTLATLSAGWVPSDSGGALFFANRIWWIGGWDVDGTNLDDVWYTRLPYQPDNKIRRASDSSYIGNDIYGTSGTSQTKTYNGSRGQTKTFYIRVQNDGATSEKIKVKSTYSGGSGYSVKYYWGLTNITSAVVAGTWKTPTLATGDSELITMRVTLGSTSSGTRTYKITSTSNTDSTKKDAVWAKVY